MLVSLGITESSWSDGVGTGRLCGHVATSADRIVAYCFGDTHTGEILVLAVLPAWENQGIGAKLLAKVALDLRRRGHERLFLSCSSNPAHRSHGFYRHLGWTPTGSRDANGDEVLECPPRQNLPAS